jgi:hypothetical protein
MSAKKLYVASHKTITKPVLKHVGNIFFTDDISLCFSNLLIIKEYCIKTQYVLYNSSLHILTQKAIIRGKTSFCMLYGFHLMMT